MNLSDFYAEVVQIKMAYPSVNELPRHSITFQSKPMQTEGDAEAWEGFYDDGSGWQEM